jgi:uncharacterized membrane protein
MLGPVALTRPRWTLAVILGVIVYFALSHFKAPIRLIAAWNSGALLFLITTIIMAVRAKPEAVRRRARSMDQGALIVLLLTLLGVGACLLTIITASDDVKSFAGGKGAAAVMVAVTVIITWLVTQCSFTLHYAHLYYGDRDASGEQHVGGLEFPGNEPPDYLDFAYFSFVLGMTFQVSDVQITNRRLRRLSLLHGLISFFFTTVILALTINLLAGLAQP